MLFLKCLWDISDFAKTVDKNTSFRLPVTFSLWVSKPESFVKETIKLPGLPWLFWRHFLFESRQHIIVSMTITVLIWDQCTTRFGTRFKTRLLLVNLQRRICLTALSSGTLVRFHTTLWNILFRRHFSKASKNSNASLKCWSKWNGFF